MANNIQYTIGFKADNSQAKKALQELSSAFEKLEKKQISLNYNDLDLNKAVESAKELQIELNKATNINTGKLNLSDFVSNLSQSKTSLKELSMNLISAGKEGQQAFASLANSISQAEVPLKQTNSVLKNFAQTLKNTVKWEISSNVVHGLESALSGAVSYVKSLNSSLNDIRIVTGYSADDMTRFAQQANKAAKELSTTTKAYADASLIYFQQGDAAETVAKKAAITTKAANTAFSASAEEMSEMLTAVWNSYQVGEEELERYVDIMAALGAATATSTEEIATAMQKVAATANTVGVSMEQMSSIIATVSSVTREAPESIGTSFKTILARIGDLKIGETLDDGMSLGTVSSQLAAVGVNILDTTGELRDMGDVIEELMSKWEGMTSAEKTAVAQAVAGKRQYTQLMALMENQDMYQKSMSIAESAEGTLQKQADIYAESWSAASNRMQASFEALYSKILNDKVLITFANGISKITDSVSALIDAFGGLPGLLTTVGAVATKVFSNQINAGLTRTIGNISTYFSQFSGVKDFANKIGHGKTKTTAEIKDEQARNQANQIFTDLRSKVSDGSSEAYTIDSAKSLLSYKQQLINVENQLNDAEKQSALTAMDSLSQQQQAVANLLAEKEKLLLESKTERNKDISGVAQSIEGKEGIGTKRTKIDEEIASNTELLKMAGKDDGSEVALTENVTSLNQLLEVEQAQSKMANLAASFKNQIKQIQDAGENSADVIKDTIKRINSALGVEIPENSTLDEVSSQLDEIQRKAEATQDDLEEILDLTLKDGSEAKKKAYDAFNNATETGAEQATLEFSILANESSVSSLKKKMEEALNPKSETYSKIATGLTKAAGYAQNLVSSFSTGTNLVATMTDETATLSDKIGAVSGGISSLASGFLSGGWIGLAISAIGLLVSGIIEANKKAKEEYQKAQAEKMEKITDKGQEISDEVETNRSLIQSYNTLYEAYLKTGEGQEELKESAYELAEAYGIVGANLLIASGNFEEFNKLMGKGIAADFSKQINEYESLLTSTETLLQDEDENSIYYYTGYVGKKPGSETSNEKYASAVGVEEGYSQWQSQPLWDFGYGKSGAYHDYVTLHTGNPFTASDNKVTVDVDKFMQDIYTQTGSYETAAIQFKEMMESFDITPDDAFMESLKAYDPSTELGEQIFEAPELSFQDYSKQAGNFSDLTNNAIKSVYDKYYGSDGSFTTDYEQNFFDKDGNLQWNDFDTEEKDAAWQEISNIVGMIQEEQKSIADQMEQLQEKGRENSYEYGLLQERFNYLGKLYGTYNSLLNDENIAPMMNNRSDYKQQASQLHLAQSSITTLFGSNEETTTFSDFSEMVNNFIDTIKNNSTLYEDQLGEFIDDNGNILDQDGYNQAVQQIVMDLIDQYTSFDDYGRIWETLGAYFTDAAQLQEVVNLISDNNLNSKDITMDFILAAQSAMRNGSNNLADDKVIQDLIKMSETENDFTAKQTNRDAVEQAKSLIDEDMTPEEGSQIFDLLWGENKLYEGDDLISWDEFVNLSSTAQKAYLDSIIQEDQDGMAELAKSRAKDRKEIYENWANNWNESIQNTDNNEESLSVVDQMKDEEEQFWTWLEEQGYAADGLGGYIVKDTGAVADISEYTWKHSALSSLFSEDIGALLDENDLGDSLQESADAAENVAYGYELWGNNVDQTATKLNRLKNALSGLPTELEDLKNLAEDLGIDLSSLVTLDDLELAQKILYNLKMPTLEDFTDDETHIVDYEGYIQAMQAYEEAYSSATSTILTKSEAEFEAFKGQLEEIEKEINIIEEKAEVLQSAINDGKLSLQQQTLFSTDELSAWNSAANAVERAAIAANMWSQSAKENTEYAQRASQFYTDAANNNFYDTALENLSDKQGELFGTKGQKNFENLLGWYENQGWFDPGEAAAWSTAYQNALSKGLLKGVSDNTKVIQIIRKELLSMADDATEEGEKAAAAAADNIKTIFSSIAEEEQAAADAAVGAWEDAFNRIAELRKKILSGEDIMGDIFGGSISNLWQQFKDSGYSNYMDFSNVVKAGTYIPQLPEFDLNEYLASVGIDQFMGLKSGNDSNFIFRQDMLNRYKQKYFKEANINEGSATDEDEKAASLYAESQLEEDVRTALTEYQGANGTNYDIDEAVLAYMTGNWTKQFDDGTGKMVTASQLFNIAANTMSSASQEMSDDLKWYQQQQEIISEGKGIVSNLEENQTYTVGTGQANQEELQSLQAAIQRAQEEKYTGDGDWNNLNAADQELLSSYGISFNNVDTAAEQCANGLTALAEVAYQAMEAFLNNKGYGKKEDGWYDSNGQFVKSITEYMEELNDARQTSYTNAQDDATRTSKLQEEGRRKEWEGFDLDADEVDEFGDHLQSMAKFSDELSDSLEDNADAADEVAKEVMRFGKACESVRKDYKNWLDILKSDNMEDQAKAIKQMDKAYSDMLDLDYDTLSNGFLENTDNLELMKEAAEGSEEAYRSLQEAARQDIAIQVGLNDSDFQNQFNNLLQQYYNVQSLDDIQIGAALDDAGFLDALSEMVTAAGMTADQAQSYLSSMGVDAEVEQQEQTTQEIVGNNLIANTGVRSVNYSVPVDGGSSTLSGTATFPYVQYTSEPVIATKKTTATALKVTSANKSSGGAFKFNQSSAASGAGSKSSGGGGGGGGGEPKKIDKKDPEDEKERYHHINKVLDRLSDQLDEVDKKKSRVYGKGYLDYLSQEIALTEKECDAYQRYIDEAKEYLALDTQRVASLGATFDEFGNIENYDEVMDNIIGKYNEFVDRYNAMSASEQEAAEEEKTEWDEWYDEKKKWIENYEDTVATIYEQQNNLLEAQNKISEKTLEGIQYKVEIHVDMTDAEKDFLDYLNDAYDELLEKQGDVMNNLVRETELAVSNLNALGQSKEELDAAFASGKLSQADYVEGLKDVNEQILDNLGNIQDLKKEIEELYGDTLEMASEAFDEQTEKVKNASEAMSSYISILGLIGKGSNLKDLTKFYESQYEYNLQSLEMQKEYLDILRSEEEYYLERMNSAEGLTETERQQYEDLEQTIADVNSNILSDTESTLNQIAEAFNNEIEIIFKDLEERIAGVGNSIQDLADAYSYYQEEQSRYVTSARELYEVNKLNRQIEKTMNETSSKVNKNLLAALQERINKQSELNELTEYDIEMNQLQYELLLKKIALEEAQNAKSTVRLTRDSGGNYVYQYTADQDDIATKQQEYEDVLQQINNLSVDRVQNLESQLLEIYQNTLSKIKEIAQDQTLTEEEKYDKIQTIMDQFKEQTNFIQEQYQIASDNLITSNLAISEHYGQQLIEHSENAKNGLNQTIAAMIADTESLQQALEEACANQIPAAMDTMQSRIDAVTAAVNLDYNLMSESVNTYNKVTKDAQDQTNKAADSLSEELLPAIHSATNAWDAYADKLKNVISTYESMYQAILKTIQAQAQLSNATAPSTVKSSGSGKFTDTTTPSANNNTASGSGGGSGDGASGSSSYGSTQYTIISYKILTAAGGAQGQAVGGSPSGPKKLAVGSTGTLSHNPDDGFIKAGWSISDPSKLSISGDTMTALAAGSVTVTVKYWDRRSSTATTAASTSGGNGGGLKYQKIAMKYATGGLADFTGPAWLDGTKSKPEIVLNPQDTENILTAVQGVRALDSSTLSMLNKYITNASLAMSFGLGNISAGSVYGATDTIQQEVHITAEFPNATNSAEIQDAFDNIINRATQYITTKK